MKKDFKKSYYAERYPKKFGFLGLIMFLNTNIRN
jgi:hypothetical protein